MSLILNGLFGITIALTAPPVPDMPTVVIADTVKGKGVSFMESVAKWHHGVPSDAEYRRAVGELEAARVRLESAAAAGEEVPA